MTFYIVYHRKDLDGIASGSIVQRAIREQWAANYQNTVFVPHDYNDPTDWIRKVKLGDRVYLVDISLSRADWATLLGVVGAKIVWIDHHVTAIQDYLGGDGKKGWKEEFRHLPSMSQFTVFLGDSMNHKAGCKLTWEHFYPGKPVPEVIEELSRFDVWDDADKEHWDKITMPLHHIIGLRWEKPQEPPSYAFDVTLDPEVRDGLFKSGSLLYEASKKSLAASSGNAFETKFQDLPAIVLNRAGQGSLAFEKVYDPAKHKIMVSFFYDGRNKVWSVGLYSTQDDVHCGNLAKLYGGGGHKGAAGFSVKKLSDAFPKYF